jgi:hypothetical protein
MSTMSLSGNGFGVVVQVGRQGLPGPAGPQSPFGQSFDLLANGAGPVALTVLPALPSGVVGAQVADGYIVAQNAATGDMCVWQIVVAVRRGTDGTLAFPGNPADGSQAPNPSVTLLIGDASMLPCVITPVLGLNALEIDGAGLADTQIRWTGSLTIGGNTL